MSVKRYIGDAVYVDLDDSGRVILATEDGIRTTNRIVLEPQVLEELERWAAETGASLKAGGGVPILHHGTIGGRTDCGRRIDGSAIVPLDETTCPDCKRVYAEFQEWMINKSSDPQP